MSRNPLFIDAENKPCVVCDSGYCRGASCSERHNGACVYSIKDDVCSFYGKICGMDKKIPAVVRYNCGLRSEMLADYFCRNKTHQLSYFEPSKDECARCDRIFLNVTSPKIKIQGRFYGVNTRVEIYLQNVKRLLPTNGRRYHCFDNEWNKNDYLFNNYLGGQVLEPFNEYPFQFWCEGYSYPNYTLVQSNIYLVDAKDYIGYLFSVKLRASFEFNHIDIATEIQAQLNKTKASVRALALLPSIETKHNTFLFQIAEIKKEKDNLNNHDYYNLISRVMNKTPFELEYIRNSRFCLSINVTLSKATIFWPEIRLGTTAISENCNLMRTCRGSPEEGTFWSPIIGVCNQTIQTSTITISLISLLSEEFPNFIPYELNQILLNKTDLTPYDVLLASKIFERISMLNKLYSVHYAVDTMNTFLQIDHNILIAAQNQFGATDNLLRSNDLALNNKQYDYVSINTRWLE